MPKPIINYTNRDFESIRRELIEHVKINYPDTYKDFNKSSFGSLMLDLTALIGDKLSYYLDFSANESVLSTAIQYDNIVNLAKANGYNIRGAPSASGRAAIYLRVPANSTGTEPNESYIPVLEKGSIAISDDGNSYILNEDVRFDGSDVQVIVSDVSSETGIPTYFALKTYGEFISGEIKAESFTIGNHSKFLEVPLTDKFISEILTCVDSSGNEYYQVDYLSQNVVYTLIPNTNEDKQYSPYTIKEIHVPRRFVVEYDGTHSTLVFGFGSMDQIADPREVAINVYGKSYIVEDTFDPANIIASDKFGLAPSNTTLTVTYRSNTTSNMNASVGAISNFVSPLLKFNTEGLSQVLMDEIFGSIEISNEEPIVGSTTIGSIEEIKTRAYDSFATQNRAVTKQDYISLAYRMNPKLGSIKRANIIQDGSSFKRNLNMFVISEDTDGNLIQCNGTLKNNLKKWLSNYKMINDTIDILDARIVNIGIEFSLLARSGVNKYDVLIQAMTALRQKYQQKLDIGKPFYITEIYKTLNMLNNVVDTRDVKIVLKNSSQYSFSDLDIEAHLSPDARYIDVPEDVILEIKYPDMDISGVII